MKYVFKVKTSNTFWVSVATENHKERYGSVSPATVSVVTHEPGGGLEMVWVLHSWNLFCLHRLCLRISMPSLFQELTSPASSKASVPFHLHRLGSYISSHLSAPWSHSLNTHQHGLYIGRPRLLLSRTPSVSPAFHVDTLLSAHMPASSRLNTSPHLSSLF